MVASANNKSKPVTRPVNYTKNRNEKPSRGKTAKQPGKPTPTQPHRLWLALPILPLPSGQQADGNRLTAAVCNLRLYCHSVWLRARAKMRGPPPFSSDKTHAEILAKLLVALATFRRVYREVEVSHKPQNGFLALRSKWHVEGRGRFGCGFSGEERPAQESKSLADIDNNPVTQWFHKREMNRRRFGVRQYAGRKLESSHVGVH